MAFQCNICVSLLIFVHNTLLTAASLGEKLQLAFMYFVFSVAADILKVSRIVIKQVINRLSK